MAKIRRNDTVLVTTGKDRGKRGKVARVLPRESRVLIEGVNIVKRHLKARPPAIQAGIVLEERPIQIANVALICPHCEKPTRVGHRFLEDGTKVRQCKQCDQVVE